MYETIANLNPYQLYTLAAHHVYTYSNRCEEAEKRASSPIRQEDCRALLDIWVGVKSAALRAFEAGAATLHDHNLTVDQEDEVLDAIASGEFDDLLIEHQER